MNMINKQDFFLLSEIIKRNFSSKYKDSVLGILWSVLRPLLMMLILTIVFSTIFNGMVENYPVFLLSARCIYDFFVAATGLSLTAIKNNVNILQKTAAPKYIFVIGCVLSEFINFIITLIILIGVMIATNNQFYFHIMPLSIIPIISLFLMIMGISFILSIICVYYTDINHLWGIITLIVMYSSAIFYPMEIIPDPYHYYLSFNPMYWIIEQFRYLFTLGIIPNTLNIINSILFSLIIFVFGIIVFKKYEKRTALKL